MSTGYQKIEETLNASKLIGDLVTDVNVDTHGHRAMRSNVAMKDIVSAVRDNSELIATAGFSWTAGTAPVVCAQETNMDNYIHCDEHKDGVVLKTIQGYRTTTVIPSKDGNVDFTELLSIPYHGAHISFTDNHGLKVNFRGPLWTNIVDPNWKFSAECYIIQPITDATAISEVNSCLVSKISASTGAALSVTGMDLTYAAKGTQTQHRGGMRLIQPDGDICTFKITWDSIVTNDHFKHFVLKSIGTTETRLYFCVFSKVIIEVLTSVGVAVPVTTALTGSLSYINPAIGIVSHDYAFNSAEKYVAPIPMMVSATQFPYLNLTYETLDSNQGSWIQMDFSVMHHNFKETLDDMWTHVGNLSDAVKALRVAEGLIHGMDIVDADSRTKAEATHKVIDVFVMGLELIPEVGVPLGKILKGVSNWVTKTLWSYDDGNKQLAVNSLLKTELKPLEPYRNTPSSERTPAEKSELATTAKTIFENIHKGLLNILQDDGGIRTNKVYVVGSSSDKILAGGLSTVRPDGIYLYFDMYEETTDVSFCVNIVGSREYDSVVKDFIIRPIVNIYQDKKINKSSDKILVENVICSSKDDILEFISNAVSPGYVFTDGESVIEEIIYFAQSGTVPLRLESLYE